MQLGKLLSIYCHIAVSNCQVGVHSGFSSIVVCTTILIHCISTTNNGSWAPLYYRSMAERHLQISHEGS